MRLHAHVIGQPTLDGVVGRLVASRVAPGPVTFLGYLDSPPTKLFANQNRTSFGTSFNFQLPASWRSGTIQIVGLADFPNDVKEPNEANNNLFTTVTFDEVPPMRVRVYATQYPDFRPPRHPWQRHESRSRR